MNIETLTVRIPEPLSKRIDAVLETLAPPADRLSLTRSDVVRMAIDKGLSALEKGGADG